MDVGSAQERRIGRYVLLDELGRGAMGVVYRAQDPLIDRTVAVKLLHVSAGLSDDESRVVQERFVREAQGAGRLDHPNIVRIFDVGEGEETGELYIVMEHISGPSLDDLLREGRIEREAIPGLLRQVASGIDAAHAQGIVHRDIKPGNILFTEEGVPKITDFGVARIGSTHLTQDVRDFGTPIYMSPEQALGERLDGRADLFSLGVVAYHLLAGRPPFEGHEAVALAYQIVHATPPPLSALVPDLPPALDAVMERALAKNPADRFATGREFCEAFQEAFAEQTEISSEEHVVAVAPPVPFSPPTRYVLGGLAALALVVLLILGLRGRGSKMEWAPAEAPAVISMTARTPTSPPAVPSPAPSAARSSARPRAPARSAPSVSVPVAKRPPDVSHDKETLPAQAPPSLATGSAKPSPAPVEVSSPIPEEPPPTAAAEPGGDLSVTIAHWITRGTLTVWLDGEQILRDTFSKKLLVPFQTTTWDPITIPSGPHRLTAAVVGTKGKVYVSEPFQLEAARTRTSAVRIGFKNDALVIRRKEKGEKDSPD